MGYSVNWVEKNLGISRDAIRYYEKEKLLPANIDRKYREFSDVDIEKIWGIKLLIGIGFTAKEIYALMNDPKFDFDTAIAKKVIDLEKEHDKNVLYLEFAKSIKLTGRVPTTTKLGSMQFKDFLAYARANWNFYDDPRSAPFMRSANTLISKAPQEWDPDDVEQILKLFQDFNPGQMMHIYALHGYCQVISDMRDFDHDSDVVQRVVRLLHEYLVANNMEPELEGKITPQVLAKHTAPFFLGGDIATLHKRNYGEEGCLFIARALAHYGGYDIEDL